MDNKQERNWAVGCHVCGLIPFYLLDIVGPLLIWLLKKKESAFIDEQGKESLNFQISLCIYSAAFVIMAFTVILMPLALLGGFAMWIFNLVCVIKAAIKASNGEKYLYPFNLRLIK